MKIVMVSGHSCIRVHKQALPLIDRGHDVHLIAKKEASFSNYYKSFLKYANIDQCIESIKLHAKDADVFHVHNEPSWFVCAIKEITDKPVVLDVHDTYLTRSTPEEADQALAQGHPHVRVTAEERAAFQLADALNFVSERVRDVTVAEFKLSQPTLVLPSYVPRALYKYHFKEWLGGLVYEGRVTLPDEHEGRKGGTGAGYCDYLDCADKAHAIGMDFHLYAGRDTAEFKSAYADKAFIHRGYAYGDLLDQVSRHDWGLVGNTVDSPQWQQTLSNKMFDYIAAGVPMVCINASESAKIAREYGFGIEVSGLDELARRWSEHRQCRAKVFKHRQDVSMDTHIHTVEALYREVL